MHPNSTEHSLTIVVRAEASIFRSLGLRIGAKIVRLSQGQTNALASLRFISKPKENVHVSMIGVLTASSVAVPADVESVRSVVLVEKWTCFAEQLKRGENLLRREVERCRMVSLRNDHPAPAQQVTFKSLRVEEHAVLVFKQDAGTSP